MLQHFFVWICQKWRLQSDWFLVNNSHSFYLFAGGMTDIVDHNTTFYVRLWCWLYRNYFMKDICFILNDHCWLIEHIKCAVFICQVHGHIIRNWGYNGTEALSLMYCVWFRTAFGLYFEVLFSVYVETKAVLCTLFTQI